MIDTKPQPCPKCGEPATRLRDDDAYRCSDVRCSFHRYMWWLLLEDWNALRYVKPEDAPKPRRMRGEGHGCSDAELCYHNRPHDEDDFCLAHGCQPVKAEQDHIADNSKMVAPNPGEGWRWVWIGETLKSDDESMDDPGKWVRTAAAGKINSQYFTYRRRIEADIGGVVAERRIKPEKHAWEDKAIFPGANGVLSVHSASFPYPHTLAPSLRGFMGFRYVYENGETDTRAEPCVYDGESGEMLFPVAVRFKK